MRPAGGRVAEIIGQEIYCTQHLLPGGKICNDPVDLIRSNAAN